MNRIIAQSLYLKAQFSEYLPEVYITCRESSTLNRSLYLDGNRVYQTKPDGVDEAVHVVPHWEGGYRVYVSGQVAYEGTEQVPYEPWTVTEWLPMLGGPPINVIKREENQLMVSVWSETNGQFRMVPWVDLRNVTKKLNALAGTLEGLVCKAGPIADGGGPECESHILLSFEGWESPDVMACVWITGGPPVLYSDDGIVLDAQLVYRMD